jgi:hypothetical protein
MTPCIPGQNPVKTVPLTTVGKGNHTPIIEIRERARETALNNASTSLNSLASLKGTGKQVCVCVCEKERERREREKVGGNATEHMQPALSVWVWVWVCLQRARKLVETRLLCILALTKPLYTSTA